MAGQTLDPKTLAMIQASTGAQAANRSGKSGPRLLDDAENNVGNSTVLQPQVLPAGQLFTTIPQATTNNGRLINLTAESKTGQNITVVVTSSKLANQKGKTGPFTAIAEFGNGSVTTKFEFDVPFGPFHSDSLVGTLPNDEPQDSGAIIQLPSGIMRLYARYDNAFVTPEIGGYAFGGPGSPVPLPTLEGPFPPNGIPSPLTTKSFVAYFGRPRSKLYKTQYIYTGNTTIPISFFYLIGGNPFPTNYSIPPFAKSVKLIRRPNTAAMLIQLVDQTTFASEDYLIPSGPAPTIPIVGNETIITVASATSGNADKVTTVELVYEIGF